MDQRGRSLARNHRQRLGRLRDRIRFRRPHNLGPSRRFPRPGNVCLTRRLSPPREP